MVSYASREGGTSTAETAETPEGQQQQEEEAAAGVAANLPGMHGLSSTFISCCEY